MEDLAVNDRPNPAADVVTFLSGSGWPTPVFWMLLLASCAIAAFVWWRDPTQRSARSIGLWLLRLLTGCMWWQQSLWKVPPNYGGLIYWMKQEVAHAAIVLQGELVDTVVLPHITLFGPLVYLIEVAIGVSLMLGLLSKWGALLGLLMGINLWLGLYSAPGEWPWTYFFLIIIQALFVIDPPGQALGADAPLNQVRASRFGIPARSPR
jgi:uncharacterized membrane protein YphA (DoxX/SURF4 family)